MRGQGFSWDFGNTRIKERRAWLGKGTSQDKPAYGVILRKSKSQAFDIMVDFLHAFESQLMESQWPHKRSLSGAVI